MYGVSATITAEYCQFGQNVATANGGVAYLEAATGYTARYNQFWQV